MGRPIKSKYFGTTKGIGIGGEGVLSISTPSNYSEVNATYTAFPSLNISAPQVPGGTTATALVTWEIYNGSVVSSGTNYTSGLTTGTEIDSQASTAPVLYLTVSGGNNVTGLDFSQLGTDRGEFTSISGAAAPWTLYKGTSSDATMNFNFRVKSIAVVNAGSGYSSAPTLTWTSSTNGQSLPVNPTATLASSVSDVLQVTAYIPVANGGSSAVTGDVQEQIASKKYRVKTAQGTGPCKLVTTSTLAAGEMYMKATDASGSTYFVKKLTAHRAVLVQDTDGGSGFDFNTNEAAGWNLDSAATGIVVIDNR